MSVTQWGSDIPDPAGNLLINFLSTNLVTNNSAYENPDVDTALERLARDGRPGGAGASI